MRALVALALAGAREAGAECAALADDELTLPPFADAGAAPPAVAALRAHVAAHDGLIIGVREASGTYAPQLANALAWLGPDAFRGKTVALVGAAPGDGAIKAINALTLALAYRGALIFPAPVGVPAALLAADGALADGRLAARIADLGRALGRFLRR